MQSIIAINYDAQEGGIYEGNRCTHDMLMLLAVKAFFSLF